MHISQPLESLHYVKVCDSSNFITPLNAKPSVNSIFTFFFKIYGGSAARDGFSVKDRNLQSSYTEVYCEVV